MNAKKHAFIESKAVFVNIVEYPPKNNCPEAGFKKKAGYHQT
jgi:hypothetical protein